MKFPTRFLLSCWRFTWGVARRAWIALVWWILDSQDIYSKMISPLLSTKWAEFFAPWIGYLGISTPYVIVVIVALATFLTYYEVEREVHRDPKITRKLKQVYEVSGEMLKRQIREQADLSQLEQDWKKWFGDTYKWIAENMEQASLDRFLYSRNQLPYNHGSPFDRAHNQLLNGISLYHENVQALIEHDRWR